MYVCVCVCGVFIISLNYARSILLLVIVHDQKNTSQMPFSESFYFVPFRAYALTFQWVEIRAMRDSK